jgi:hypothetical protein
MPYRVHFKVVFMVFPVEKMGDLLVALLSLFPRECTRKRFPSDPHPRPLQDCSKTVSLKPPAIPLQLASTTRATNQHVIEMSRIQVTQRIAIST